MSEIILIKEVKYIKGENKNIDTILKPYKKIKIIFILWVFKNYQSFKYYKNVLNIMFSIHLKL